MGKILDIEKARAEAERLRKEGKKIALANGAFDPLHVGHVRYLEAARLCADALFVAVNSDDSVRRLKGPGRPVVPEAERAEVVSALAAADYVLVFSDKTVENVIRTLRPDFHCKGTDYTPDSVPEATLVRSLGGEVRIVGDPKHHDSSAMIRRIKHNPSL